MKTVTTTEARKNIKKLVDYIRESNNLVAIGRNNKLEVLMMKFPATFNKNLNEITNLNAFSSSFDFLDQEPDNYSIDDLKKRYA